MTTNTWITLASALAVILLSTPPTKIGLLEAGILFVPTILFCLWKKPKINPRKLSIWAYLVIFFLVVYMGIRFFLSWSKKSAVISFALKLHLSASLVMLILTVSLVIFSVWFFAGLFCSVNDTFHKGIKERNLLCILLGSATAVVLSQSMIETFALAMGLFRFFWCGMIVAIVILIIYCLSGQIRVSVILGTGLFMILSTANAYVYSFRGRLLDPLDILSLGTAMNVAENYSIFPVPRGVLVGWILWVGALIFFLRISPKQKERNVLGWRVRSGAWALVGVLLIVCYTIPLKTYHWDRQGAENSGFILNFVSNLKEIRVAKPSGYTQEKIQQLSDQYAPLDAQGDEKLPHIIVIMDEAFSDLSVFGHFSTNIEPTPYISSLMESTLSGYALSSVYGGNTANSEFEMLTGNSMAWLSPNAVPYQQYLNDPAFSMVSILKSVYSYHCVAMHPYLSSGWNRPIAYKNLGFDECFFLESFPQEDIIREYVSDQEMFETLIEIYAKRRETPLFLFGISMQNHGGYSYSDDKFTNSVFLQNLDTPSSRSEQYLTLIHETDKAVEYLISYFSSVEDDVVILFFGDHQPKLDKDFYSNFPETSSDSLDDQQRKYMVPFFIWANYPLEAEHVDCTSLNYLSSYLYEAADIPLPGYNRFLSEMEQVIPAINANGYYSLEKQRYLPLDEADGEEALWLQLYQQLQYNNLFDPKNHSNEIFPLLS